MQNLVDATGLTCPLPVLRAQKALSSLKAGDIITVHATDPLSRIDIPHFCQQSGHRLINNFDQKNDLNNETVYVFEIRHK